MSEHHEHMQGHGFEIPKVRSYIKGYIFSLIITVIAFTVATSASSPHSTLIALLALALCQLVVQMVYFLHLNAESKPRWNLMVFALAAILLIAIVVGSLWIMRGLKHNDMDRMFIGGHVSPEMQAN